MRISSRMVKPAGGVHLRASMSSKATQSLINSVSRSSFLRIFPRIFSSMCSPVAYIAADPRQWVQYLLSLQGALLCHLLGQWIADRIRATLYDVIQAIPRVPGRVVLGQVEEVSEQSPYRVEVGSVFVGDQQQPTLGEGRDLHQEPVLLASHSGVRDPLQAGRKNAKHGISFQGLDKDLAHAYIFHGSKQPVDKLRLGAQDVVFPLREGALLQHASHQNQPAHRPLRPVA